MTNIEKIAALNKVTITEAQLCPEWLADCSADGISFVYGDVNELRYHVKNDIGKGHPAFSRFSDAEAFELWRTRYVDLVKEMDRSAYFYASLEDAAGGGIFSAVIKGGPVGGFLQTLCEGPQEEALLAKGESTKNFRRITAAEALPHIEFISSVGDREAHRKDKGLDEMDSDDDELLVTRPKFAHVEWRK